MALSSLQSLKSANSQSRPNLPIHIQNIIFHLPVEVTFVWIPGHSGLNCNDKVDTLAKSATLHPKVDIDIGYESSDLNKMAVKYCTSKWQNIWNSENRGRHLFSIVPTVSRSPHYICRINRHKETVVTRLLVGKCRLNYYMHIMGLHHTGLCDYCRVNETIEHYLTECPASGPHNALLKICGQKNIPMSIQHIFSHMELFDVIYNSLDRKL